MAAEEEGEAMFDEAFVAEDLGQGHLLEAVGEDDEKADQLLDQLQDLDEQYPGGLAAYVANARKLLKESQEGVNPFEGFMASVPAGERLQAATSQFEECETLGMEHVGETGFVLVAGGLGERLGYNGIKVALPAELLTSKCFLQNYCESILALQERARAATGDDKLVLPLAIMTSDDTHELTVELLHKHTSFGMAKGQILLMKQEKVPALINNDAQFAQNPETLMVETKPHGHGDVHSLLHGTGIVKMWKERGIKWLCFFQDTNALVFRALVAALGVSAKNEFDVNSLAVPRRPGEAVGAICQLESADGDRKLTINVEYNQLDPLLRGTGSDAGDVADETGFSPYPGNTNVLIFRLEPYAKVLKKSGGAIPEFVNPKYADAEKTTFKKPTRLECMMQDYPKLLMDNPKAKVGFTQMERFISFSAVKNNPTDALAKLKSVGVAESASSAESDVYATNRLILALAGVQVKTADFESRAFLGIPFAMGAKVVLAPSFGTTLHEIRGRFPTPEKVKISDRSSLLLEGDVVVEALDLDGDLRITAAPGAHIVVRNLTVRNQGLQFEPVDAEDPAVDEVLRIRGYRKVEKESLVINQADPGETVIDRP